MIDPNKILFSLAEAISNKKPYWVQGKGGNISYKDFSRNQLRIKATGLRLEDVTSEEKLSKLKMSELKSALLDLFKSVHTASFFQIEKEKKYAEILSTFLEVGSPRASMETGFHVALKQDYVIHFHPISALLMVHEFKKDPELVRDFLQSFFKGKIQIVPRVLPGLLLSATLSNKAEQLCYLLEGHGVVLQDSESPEWLLSEWVNLEGSFYKQFSYRAADRLSGPLKVYFPDTAVFLKEMISSLVSHNEELKLGVGASSDITEIWQATLKLFSLQPELETWNIDEIANMSQMPLEQIRKLS